MRASYGALSHDDILRLTWRQFECYQEAFTYLLRQENGQEDKNKEDDLAALAGDEQFVQETKSEVDAIREKVKKYKERGNRPAKGVTRRLI